MLLVPMQNMDVVMTRGVHTMFWHLAKWKFSIQLDANLSLFV